MGLFLWEEPSIILLLSQFFLSALPGDPINSLFLPLFFLDQVSAPQLDSKLSAGPHHCHSYGIWYNGTKILKSSSQEYLVQIWLTFLQF